jgi:hypothetical protein
MAMVHGALIAEERSHITTASAETIWRVWADTTTWPQWNPDVRMLQLNGFFDNGVKGTMTTSAGTRAVALTDVVQEESFTLVTKRPPLITCYYRCTIQSLAEGQTKISESISLRGPFSALIGPGLRGYIAKGFMPALKALAARAESIEQRQGPRPTEPVEYPEVVEQGADA